MQTNENKLHEKQGLINAEINIKIKLAALWVSLMLLFLYGDFISLMIPDRIMGLNDGTMGLGTTTPMKLFIVSILMAVPALMVSVALIDKVKLNRVLNIVFGLFYAFIMVLTIKSSLEEWRIFYVFLGIVEIGVSLMIAWKAWCWPKTAIKGLN